MKRTSVFLLLLALVMAATSAEAVSPCAQGFDTAADMPEAHFRGVSAVVGDYLYMIGGESGKAVETEVYIYSPLEDAWTSGTSIPVAHNGACGAAIDQYIYYVGGTSSTDVYVYDTVNDSWSTTTDYPLMQHGCMAAAIDGMLYVAGGRQPDDTELKAGYVYDPGAGTWTAIADMPTGKYWGTGFAYQGKFWTVGGWNDNSVYAYDPDTNTWSTGDAMDEDANNANIIAPEYSDSYYFWSFGYGNQWVADGNILGYETSGSGWYEASLWGDVPTPVIAAAAGNFHDALFILAGGCTGSSDGADAYGFTAATQIFNYCMPYTSVEDVYTVTNYSDTDISFHGLNYDDAIGSEYYLESSTKARVDFDNLVVVDSENITATVPAGTPVGVYDLVMVNNMIYSYAFTGKTSPGAVTVYAPLPIVDSITPDTGVSGETVNVTVDGNHLFGPPTVTLEGPTEATITATNVVVAATWDSLTADFDLTGAAAGTYDVVVETDNGTDTLLGAFTITPGADDDTIDDDTIDDDTTDDDTTDDDTTDDDITDDDITDDDVSDDDISDDDAGDDDYDDDDTTSGGGGDDDDDDSGCGC